MHRPLWIEINLNGLRDNFRQIKSLISKDVKIMATVKQFAYGHGLIPVARELSFLGVDYLGVGSIEEGIILRKDGFSQPILTLSVLLKESASSFIQHKIIPTVVDVKFAKELDRQAAKKRKVVPVHVKIDTGMGRLGLYYKDAFGFIKQLSKLRNIILEGIYTHFPVADTDPDFTNHQIDIFNKFILTLRKENIQFKLHHCANSIGIVNYPNSHFNMVRPGLILYGVKPFSKMKLEVKPVLSLKSRVIFFKEIKKGMGVSYARTYIAKKNTSIATVAIGYADGYPWALSNVAQVIIKDSFFNLAGRVCMDHIMVDLKDRKDIKLGEEVILIGQRKNLKITAEDLADWVGTIPYEIVSRLSLRIPRIYNSRFSYK